MADQNPPDPFAFDAIYRSQQVPAGSRYLRPANTFASGAPMSGDPLGWLGTGTVIESRDADIYQKLQTKERELIDARKELAKLLKEQSELKQSNKQTKEDIARVEIQVADLKRREGLSHLLRSVELKAQEKLAESEAFANEFRKDRCMAFVMSVDIRGSTDLMLKATEPREFARFITNLCSRLSDMVKTHHGIFEKFTGDGVLAFFPEFYSGEDAGILAVQAAEACHNVFEEEYRKHRNSFSSVPAEAGLGIGIDYGNIALVSDWGTVTIVGTPVVYACRLGGAPAGHTHLNQQAYSRISPKYDAFCFTEETTQVIKKETLVVHKACLKGEPYKPKLPPWLAELEAKVSNNI